LDHNWGRTISEMGLGGTGATLAARFLDFPYIVLTNARDASGVHVQLWYTALDTELPWLMVPYPTFGMNFPYIYGSLVEADGPV